MKKIITIFLITILFCGCNSKDLFNTPTKRVESFFNYYQSLDEKVMDDLKKVTAESLSFNEKQRNEYIELMKNHYKGLTYEIKDEIIDGDKATVVAEIEVNDYTLALAEADKYLVENEDEFKVNDKFDETLFRDYQLKLLKESKDRITYTLDLTLSKIDKEWVMDEISSTTEQKINGIYKY